MRSLASSADRCPSTDSSPASGKRIDMISRMVVVLPAPFGPMTPYRGARSGPSDRDRARRSPTRMSSGRPAGAARVPWQKHSPQMPGQECARLVGGPPPPLPSPPPLAPPPLRGRVRAPGPAPGGALLQRAGGGRGGGSPGLSPGCHGAALTGGTAPALTGPAFEASWSDPRVTLADIFFIARTSMPPRASSSLSAQDHAAVFAYILKDERLPVGRDRR